MLNGRNTQRRSQQASLSIHVHPSARRNEVQGIEDSVLHVRIAAPPLKGKANKELVDYLSTLLGVSKGSITIEKGLISKRKIILVTGLTQQEVLGRLEAYIGK